MLNFWLCVAVSVMLLPICTFRVLRCPSSSSSRRKHTQAPAGMRSVTVVLHPSGTVIVVVVGLLQSEPVVSYLAPRRALHQLDPPCDHRAARAVR